MRNNKYEEIYINEDKYWHRLKIKAIYQIALKQKEAILYEALRQGLPQVIIGEKLEFTEYNTMKIIVKECLTTEDLDLFEQTSVYDLRTQNML